MSARGDGRYGPLYLWWEMLEILAPFLLSILGPAGATEPELETARFGPPVQNGPGQPAIQPETIQAIR